MVPGSPAEQNKYVGDYEPEMAVMPWWSLVLISWRHRVLQHCRLLNGKEGAARWTC